MGIFATAFSQGGFLRVVAFALLSTLAWAQPLDAQQVAQSIWSAQQQVVLMAPNLSSRTVAEALRIAVTERGVRVFILCHPHSVNQPSSFLAALSLLPNVSIRLYSPIGGEWILLDQHTLIQGPLTHQNPQPWLAPTLQNRNPQQVQSAYLGFLQAWPQATPYRWRGVGGECRGCLGKGGGIYE